MAVDVVLQTWKEISEYMGRTERTVQRWEQQFGFPVHRPSGKSRSSVMALAEEIQEWTRGKPSLIVIRQTARLGRAKLVANQVDEHCSGNDGHSFSPFPMAECGGSKKLQQIMGARVRRAELLKQQQKSLLWDLRNLLREQKSLREKLTSQGKLVSRKLAFVMSQRCPKEASRF